MATNALAQAVQAVPDLTAIRDSKGITLDEIARETKISTEYLQAIESGDFSRLPGGVYNTSYIRQYARAIQYDEWDLLALYRAVSGQPGEITPVRPPQPKTSILVRLAVPLLRLLCLKKA